MRVVVRKSAQPDPDELRLLTPETSRWSDLSSNVVALVAAAIAHTQQDSHPVFKMVSQPAWDPRRSMTASVFCHAAAIFLLLNLTALWRFAAPDSPLDRANLDKRRIEWYRLTAQMPAITPVGDETKQPQEKGGRVRQTPKQGATVQHAQKIVANPPEPDNAEQTIFQPDAPKIRITQTEPLPNIVMWSDAGKAAPPVDLVARQINALKVPMDLMRRAPVERPAYEHPEEAVPAIAAKNDAVPNLPAATPTEAALPPPPDLAATSAGDAEARLRRLVVMNANPAPAGGPIEVAAGNRAGSFSTGPNGRGSGTPNGSPSGNEAGGAGGPAPAGDGTMGGKHDPSGIRVPGLAVSGGASPGGPLVSGPATGPPAVPKPKPPLPATPAAGPAARLPGPNVPRAPLPEWNARGKAEPDFTPGKRVYTVFINMPNLTSGGGGSWVLRFAELENRPPGDAIEISSPTATRKIDPGYSRDAVREKVEGHVRLHAIIRRDGKVERVEVLKSLDPRLDQRAIDAFLRWEFTPSLRLGVAVDLEAVVEIPFTLPKAI